MVLVRLDAMKDREGNDFQPQIVHHVNRPSMNESNPRVVDDCVNVAD